MATRGGRRAGAGRATDQARSVEEKRQALQLAQVQKLALNDLTQVYAKIREIAFGVQVLDEERGGVYTRPPDRQALMFIWEQAVGKAPVKKEVHQDQSISLIANVPRPKAKAEEEVEQGDNAEAVDAEGV